MSKTKTKVKTKTILLDPYINLKQGDAWGLLLERKKGNVVASLTEWADQLEDVVQGLRAVANVVKDVKGLQGEGGTHMAIIYGVPSDVADDAIKASNHVASEDNLGEESQG